MLIWKMVFKCLIYNKIQWENKMIYIIFSLLLACVFLEFDLK